MKRNPLHASSTIQFIFFLLIISHSGFAQTEKARQNNRDTIPAEVRIIYERQKANKAFFTRILSFSEISWATFPGCDQGSKKGSYILSSDIQPNFTIGGEKMRFAVLLTPRFKFRIFRNNPEFGDSSLPVRTPSAMPGATVFYPLRLVRSPYQDLEYVSLKIFHHSNGQDGDEFKGNKINEYNGNFSTNFVELVYHFNKRWKLRIDDPNFCNSTDPCENVDMPVGYQDFVGSIGLEQHFGTADSLVPTYGQTRINIKTVLIKVSNWKLTVRQKKAEPMAVGSCYKKERWRLLLDISTIVDGVDAPMNKIEKRINVEASFLLRFLGGNTSAYIAAGYYGSDPYNIYYQNNYWFARIGVALGNFLFTSKFKD